jgi:intracellular septation protein
MKLLLDFLPIILFFGTFKIADGHPDAAAKFATDHLGFVVSGGIVGPAEAAVLLATVVVIVATLLQIALLLATRRKVDAMLWVTFVLVTVLGGATVWFHNPTFIKWKPSVLYWAMSIVFWVSQTVFQKNVLQSLVGEQLVLPAPVWKRLNLAWVAFFALMGIANLYVAYNYSTSTWASFKVFGLSGLMIVFMFLQGLYVSRFMDDESAVPPERLAEATAAAEPKHPT